jgi:hypothetical protein
VPQIIVTADRGAAFGQGAVTHRERVSVADFESEHFASQLVERLGWAVGDADEVERVGEPIDAALEPIDAALEPIDAAPEPIDAAPEPIDAALEPTDAPHESMTDPAEPLSVPSPA